MRSSLRPGRLKGDADGSGPALSACPSRASPCLGHVPPAVRVTFPGPEASRFPDPNELTREQAEAALIRELVADTGLPEPMVREALHRRAAARAGWLISWSTVRQEISFAEADVFVARKLLQRHGTEVTGPQSIREDFFDMTPEGEMRRRAYFTARKSASDSLARARLAAEAATKFQLAERADRTVVAAPSQAGAAAEPEQHPDDLAHQDIMARVLELTDSPEPTRRQKRAIRATKQDMLRKVGEVAQQLEQLHGPPAPDA